MTPTSSVRRFELRLRILMALHRAVKAIDASDVLSVVSLGLIFAGFTYESIGAAVVGALLLTATPIGLALRLFIRGR